MFKKARLILNNERGMEMVQVAILIAIAIAIGVLFKSQIGDFIFDVFENLNGSEYYSEY